jgi:arylsulfatase A-like enzyme
MRTKPFAAPVSLLLLGCLTSCAPQPDPLPDVLLVTIDTLRSDYVSAYGYPRESTPNLDALARDGVLFERHRTNIPTTAPAHATMFTGLFAREHGLEKNGRILPESLSSLPELLNDRGYRTGASIGASVLGSEFGFARGFDDFDEDFGPSVARPAGKSNAYERYAESVVDRAIGIMDKDQQRPLFLWVHIYDPHEPYSPPRLSPLEPEKHLPFFQRRSQPSDAFPKELISKMLVGYEAEIAYVDTEFARLLDAWDQRATGPESLVVVTSDHGEGLGEHSYQGHGFLLYNEQLDVPLIMRMGGRIDPGLRIEGTTSAVDLGATMLQLVGIDEPDLLPGNNLMEPSSMRSAVYAERRAFSAGDIERSKPLSLLLENNAGGPLGSIGEKCVLLQEGWKFIWNQNGAHELYAVAKDPKERRNLVGVESERAAGMLAAIEAWRADTGQAEAGAASEQMGEVTQEMLDALGY